MISEYRKEIIKNLKRKYLLALVFLSLFSIVSYVFFLRSIRTTDTDGYMINLSGKERFITQRVALSALQLVTNTDSSKQESLRKNFEDRINDLENSHKFLAHDSIGIAAEYHSPEIDSIYFNAPVYLDKKINEFLKEANLLLLTKNNEFTINNPHLNTILNTSGDLLASINLIVFQYQKENEDEIHGFYYRETFMFIALLLSYFSIGAFLFRPMTKQLNNNLNDLELKELELQQINEAHIAAIIDAQEKEKQRIASDLHDGLVQTLTAIAYRMDISNEKITDQHNIQETKLLIDNAIIETRNIAHSILPPILKQFGLVSALKSLIEQLKMKSGIAFSFQTFEFSERLDNKLELALYRITQELVTNCVKHSAANNVKIQLIHHSHSIVLIVEDDGKGFNSTDKEIERGLGLINIKERASMFNGTLTINSNPNMGTEIMVEIPLEKNKKI